MYIVCVDAGVIYVYVHAYILNIHAYCCVFVGAHDYVCSYLCIYIYIHTHLHKANSSLLTFYVHLIKDGRVELFDEIIARCKW